MDNSSYSKQIRYLGALFFLAQTIAAVSFTFSVPYMEKLGFSGAQRGIISSCIAAFGILGQFVISYFCDKLGRIKVFFRATVLVLCFALILTYTFSFPFAITFVMFSLIGMLYNPALTLLDSWTLESGDEIKRRYGELRSIGALGWAIITALLGTLISAFGYVAISVCGVIVCTGALYISGKVNDVKKNKHDKVINIMSLSDLLRTKSYILLVITYLSVFFMLQSEAFIVPTKINRIGGAFVFGTYLSVQAISEMPIMAMYGRINRRFSHKAALVLAAFAYTVRALLFRSASVPAAFWLIGLTSALSYAPALISAKFLFDEIVPSHLKTAGQVMASASYVGISGIVAPTIFGRIIDKTSLDNSFLVLAAFGIIPISLSLFFYFRGNKKAA